MKAQLCVFMGIGADTNPKVQPRQPRNFCRDVRMLAGFDFTKTWTELCTAGRAEDMITSAFPLHPLIAIRYQFISNSNDSQFGLSCDQGLLMVQEHSWSRTLAVKAIRDIIHRCRGYAARKHN